MVNRFGHIALWTAILAPTVVSGHEDAQPFQRGVCYASTWRNHGADGYGSATSQQTLRRLRRLGVEWVSLTPFGFMESITAPEVHTGPSKRTNACNARSRTRTRLG
jgi:hypothetical protein